jgi:peptidoglycan/LPS O-acetylase OafA/YrhL
LRKIPQLDAVRGIAILVVILHNQGPKYPSLPFGRMFANGWMGVDLFFVLSGFLITGILLDSRTSSHYFRNFYARRCLRIWPLYYAVLLLMFVAVPLLRPSETAEIFERSSPWWSYPIFLQNLLLPVATNAPGPLGVTWSLAIEEQFYLVWPWIVGFCSNTAIRSIAVVTIAASPVLRLYLSFHDVNLYTNTFCRLDGLMAGSLLALAVRSEGFVAGRYIRLAWVFLFVTLPLAFVAESWSARWIGFSLVALAASAFVYLSLFSTQRWLQTLMTNRFLVYTGTISYGLYLLHKLPFDVADTVRLEYRPIMMMTIGLVACYVIAAISWNLLEKPFLRLKRFFESGHHRVDAGRHVLEPAP